MRIPVGFVHGYSIEYACWPVLQYEPDQYGFCLMLCFFGWRVGIHYMNARGREYFGDIL